MPLLLARACAPPNPARCCGRPRASRSPAPRARAAARAPQVPLWDELWWDDGLMHSQPVLDGVGEPTLFTPVRFDYF